MVASSYSCGADNRKSTLVFCVNISHITALTQKFRDAGVDARCVSSKTPAAEQKLLVEDFKARKYPVIVNCGLLSLLPMDRDESNVLKRSRNLN